MPGLGFLSPLFLLGALAVAVPVVLHLLRQRVDPILPFSAVRFLRNAPVERNRHRRLRDLLLFLVRVAALLLLALGFARPYLRRASAVTDPPVTVVLADVSASMGGNARVARLRDLVRTAVDGAPSGNAVALVRFASTADVLVAPTLDRGAVKAAASLLEPGFAPTVYRAGLARAAEVLAGRPGRVSVVTDLQASGWSDAPATGLPSGTKVDVADVGPLPPDIGVVMLETADGNVIARVRNTGPGRSATVTFEVEGGSRAAQTIALPENGVAEVSARISLPTHGTVSAQVADAPGLPADDVRWFVPVTRASPRVLLVTSPGASAQDALYARQALRALDGVRSVEVTTVAADRLDGPSLTSVQSVVLIGTTGLDRRGVELLARYVRDGGGLFVAVGPGLNPELLTAGFGDEFPRIRLAPGGSTPLALAAAETRHPALGVFSDNPGAFNDVRFTRVADVLGTPSTAILARFDSGAPALVTSPYGRGRVAVFASDVANRWNDLVLQPAFVPFLGEMVRWLSGTRRPPDGLIAGATLLAGAERPGVLDWHPAGSTDVTRVAVNVDPREFDPSRQTAAAFLAQVPTGGASEGGVPEALARKQEAAQGLWRYGLGLMALGLVLESLVGRRV